MHRRAYMLTRELPQMQLSLASLPDLPRRTSILSAPARRLQEDALLLFTSSRLPRGGQFPAGRH